MIDFEEKAQNRNKILTINHDNSIIYSIVSVSYTHLDVYKRQMVTGWLQYGGTWYYMGQDGAMLTDTVTPDQYRVGVDGALVE